MPIRDFQINREPNALFQQILGGATTSLSGALTDAVRLTRDLNNNQAAQEEQLFAERRFDRSFREDRFRDRRDFDRNVLTQDRAFGEDVRQFNVLDSDRDSDRALRAELGRGNLSIARENVGIRRGEFNLRERQFNEIALPAAERAGEESRFRNELLEDEAVNRL